MDEDRNAKKESLYRSKKTISLLLAILIYLSFIGMELGRIQAITDFNYRLHEMLYIPANLAICTVPFLFIIYLIIVIKSLKYRTGKPALKSTIKTLAVILSFVIIFSILGYQAREVSTSGVYTITQKYQVRNKYYILIEDKKVRISRNEYYLISLKGEYMVSFLWNRNAPDKGSLEIIEPVVE